MSDEVGAFLCGSIACAGPGIVLGILALRSASASKQKVEALERSVEDLRVEVRRAWFEAEKAAKGEVTRSIRPAGAPPVSEPTPEAPRVAREAAEPVAPGTPPAAPTEGGPSSPEAAQKLGGARPPPRPKSSPTAPPPPVPPPSTPIDTGKLIERGAVWFFAGIGGLLALVAVLFGLREAVRAGWLGPAARFAMGIGTGVGAFAAGEGLRSRRYTIPAEALFAVGAGASYAALYAGHARYGLLGQGATFGMMVAVSAVTMFVSARRGSQFGTALAGIGGYLVPVLLSTGENKPIAFFSYLALLDLGLLYVARRRGWISVTALSVLVTAGLYAGWAAQWRAPDQVIVGLVSAAALAALHLGFSRGTELRAHVGTIGAILLWSLGALVFGSPTDPLSTDPRSGLPLPASLGLTAWFGLAYLAVGALGLPLSTRGRIPSSWIAYGAVGLALLVHALGWTSGSEPQWTAAATGLVLIPALVALAGAEAAAGILYVVAGGAAVLAASLVAPSAPTLFALSVGIGLGAAVLGWTRGPRVLLPLATFAAALPLYPGLEDRLGAGEASWLLSATLIVYAAHTWPPFWRPRERDLVGAVAGVLPGLVLFWPFYQLWIAELGEGYIGLLALLLGGSTLLGAVSLVRVARARADSGELALVAGTVLLFISIAVPLQLRNGWLTVGWALEVVALAALSRRLSHGGLKVFGALLASAVLVRLLLNPEALRYGGGEGLILLNWTLYTWGIPLVCMLAASRLFTGPPPLVGYLRIGAILLGFALVNLEIAHAFAHDSQLSFTSENLGQGMVRSIAWALYGLLLIVVGVVGDRRSVRLFGLLFALLGAGKVFMVDLWSLSGFARVGSLAGVAVTLLLAAVAFQRLVLRERSS